MATKPPSSDTVDFLPFALLHQAGRDAALGLPRPGARTLNLLDYRRQQEREATRSLMGAAFLKAIIDECRAQVKELIEAADTPEARRAALPEAQRLNELAEEAAAALEKMTYAG